MRIPLVDLKAQLDTIRPELYDAIHQVIESTDFIMGHDVQAFETEFAAFCDVEYCCSVANGTDALIIALKALGISSGDRVITVPNTFIASAASITRAGGIVDFVDVDPDTMLMDCNQLEQRIVNLRRKNISVKGIIPVHLYGQPCNMNDIMSIAKKYELFVIEDSAQAHGAMFKGTPIGKFGDVATFSFFPGKNLGAYGDGGAIITQNYKFHQIMSTYKNQGRNQGMKYEHELEGYNSRLDTIQAAILRVKLRHLSRWTEQRIDHAQLYMKLLSGIDGLVLPFVFPQVKHVYHQFVVRTQLRDQLQQHLNRAGIACGIHYPIPLHLQPAFNYRGFVRGAFPHSEKAAGEVLSLPMYAELSNEQIEHIAENVKTFMQMNR